MDMKKNPAPRDPSKGKESSHVIKNAELETVCGITSRLPENHSPEFAFAGKSNVGKSSLINALMNRKSLARTSAQPGKTQTINFYKIRYENRSAGPVSEEGPDLPRSGDDELYFVDLPGYGYTRIAVEVKAQWGKMIERYLKKSSVLRCVFLLVDIRHEPSDNDRMMYDWVCHNGYRPVVIATKLDKVKRSQVPKQIKQIKEGLGMPKEGIVIPFSAETRQGREEIWSLIDGLCGAEAKTE